MESKLRKCLWGVGREAFEDLRFIARQRDSSACGNIAAAAACCSGPGFVSHEQETSDSIRQPAWVAALSNFSSPPATIWIAPRQEQNRAPTGSTTTFGITSRRGWEISVAGRPILAKTKAPGSGGRTIFPVRAAPHDFQRVVRQRPLKRLCLVPRRTHPDVVLFVGGQDDWHLL